MKRTARVLAITAALLAAPSAFAEDDPASPASGAMTIPSMTGPLAANPTPTSIDMDSLGTWYVTGAVSGLGQWQNNRSTGDREALTDVSNGQVFIQKTAGEFQFFVQAGAYAMPALGTPYLAANKTANAYFGALPQAFIKYAPNDNFSVLAGKLPTLIGAEYTFTFENMNIERGLLWNQENAVNRGVQANYSQGPLALAVSLNDGFYSNRYNWLWGSLAYSIDKANSLSFIAGGNVAQSDRATSATPLLQNNSAIFNVIYTHTSGALTITPYLQYTRVPANTDIGIAHSVSTRGAALLASYAVNPNFSLAGRLEYIDSSGSANSGAPNLLYGPGSKAWSFTLTPTYQYKRLFVRGELSYVKAGSTTPGFGFGASLDQTSQSRLLLETGLLL